MVAGSALESEEEDAQERKVPGYFISGQELVAKERNLVSLEEICLPSRSGLTSLDVSGNALCEISALRYCVNLRNLNLSRNRLRSLPTDVFRALEDLQVLDASHNLLKSSRGLLFCQQLESVFLENNSISIVEDFECVPNLCLLDLSNNNICHVVSLRSLSLCPNLTHLHLKGNLLFTQPKKSLKGVRGEVANLIPALQNLDGHKMFQHSSAYRQRVVQRHSQLRLHTNALMEPSPGPMQKKASATPSRNQRNRAHSPTPHTTKLHSRNSSAHRKRPQTDHDVLTVARLYPKQHPLADFYSRLPLPSKDINFSPSRCRCHSAYPWNFNYLYKDKDAHTHAVSPSIGGQTGSSRKSTERARGLSPRRSPLSRDPMHSACTPFTPPPRDGTGRDGDTPTMPQQGLLNLPLPPFPTFSPFPPYVSIQPDDPWRISHLGYADNFRLSPFSSPDAPPGRSTRAQSNQANLRRHQGKTRRDQRGEGVGAQPHPTSNTRPSYLSPRGLQMQRDRERTRRAAEEALAQRRWQAQCEAAWLQITSAGLLVAGAPVPPSSPPLSQMQQPSSIPAKGPEPTMSLAGLSPLSSVACAPSNPRSTACRSPATVARQLSPVRYQFSAFPTKLVGGQHVTGDAEGEEGTSGTRARATNPTTATWKPPPRRSGSRDLPFVSPEDEEETRTPNQRNPHHQTEKSTEGFQSQGQITEELQVEKNQTEPAVLQGMALTSGSVRGARVQEVVQHYERMSAGLSQPPRQQLQLHPGGRAAPSSSSKCPTVPVETSPNMNSRSPVEPSSDGGREQGEGGPSMHSPDLPPVLPPPPFPPSHPDRQGRSSSSKQGQEHTGRRTESDSPSSDLFQTAAELALGVAAADNGQEGSDTASAEGPPPSTSRSPRSSLKENQRPSEHGPPSSASHSSRRQSVNVPPAPSPLDIPPAPQAQNGTQRSLSFERVPPVVVNVQEGGGSRGSLSKQGSSVSSSRVSVSRAQPPAANAKERRLTTSSEMKTEGEGKTKPPIAVGTLPVGGGRLSRQSSSHSGGASHPPVQQHRRRSSESIAAAEGRKVSDPLLHSSHTQQAQESNHDAEGASASDASSTVPLPGMEEDTQRAQVPHSERPREETERRDSAHDQRTLNPLLAHLEASRTGAAPSNAVAEQQAPPAEGEDAKSKAPPEPPSPNVGSHSESSFDLDLEGLGLEGGGSEAGSGGSVGLGISLDEMKRALGE
uniref:U2A'/phosphoprotein 32 family A C-terminal domain-containing protein n=1 Tax=Chromera velia CCMP2878 TaxID=1169474 RepID=A0A0G4FL31_9ALVE|eukprot:Cvel_3429.t1-p1 / transcript=Cvel_3429.t1 / gene=Cvel_3429 / organism=Chromera_velia_CCMP2878 / gene_product=hypothetical protein / transcript_product=hypothetical protein / location=Cvel_scaffold138:27536-31296(+) / protein_length=1212 / sequence_SO=supercontig / SO=protein_coding / is_pseudo=false